jgi:YD repeat-containing protein
MTDGPGRVDYNYDKWSRLISETRSFDGMGQRDSWDDERTNSEGKPAVKSTGPSIEPIRVSR